MTLFVTAAFVLNACKDKEDPCKPVRAERDGLKNTFENSLPATRAATSDALGMTAFRNNFNRELTGNTLTDTLNTVIKTGEILEPFMDEFTTGQQNTIRNAVTNAGNTITFQEALDAYTKANQNCL